MVNFRIRNLDAMAAQLRAADIRIDVDRSITRTVTLLACTILRAIRLSYGNQRVETLRVRLPFKRTSQVVAHTAQQPLEP